MGHFLFYGPPTKVAHHQAFPMVGGRVWGPPTTMHHAPLSFGFGWLYSGHSAQLVGKLHPSSISVALSFFFPPSPNFKYMTNYEPKFSR